MFFRVIDLGSWTSQVSILLNDETSLDGHRRMFSFDVVIAGACVCVCVRVFSIDGHRRSLRRP